MSQGLKYVIQKGWDWQGGDGGQIQVYECPFCHKSDFKFYMAVGNPAESSRDGLWCCYHSSCNKTGNLRSLMELLGDRIVGVESRAAWAGDNKLGELPDTDVCHATLLGDAIAMDYLLNVRHLSKEIICQQKLGLKDKVYFHEIGEAQALVIPYLSSDGKTTFAKYRTLPPNDKAFASPKGWEVGLFNMGALNDDCKEIIMVEGEMDCLSCLTNGIINVVGIPGAGVRKAQWIATLDKIDPKIYIMFDSDQAGTKGSQELASRIGLEKCLKITLPTGIKDINQYFVEGGTLEGFEKLKEKAKLFDVNYVKSSLSSLEQLENELEGRTDLAPTYITQWKELNRLVGFESGDVVDIMGPAKQGKSTTSLNILDHLVSTYSEDALYICLEMSEARLARKWVSLVTGFNDEITEPGTEASKTKLKELKEAIIKAKEIQKNRGGDIFFSYPQGVKEPEDIFKLIRDCIRRYGVKFIVFDNVQLLCDSTLGNKQGFRAVMLSQISKGFARLAKEYGVILFRILQPKKIDKSSIIDVVDVDGSSHLEKDSDCLITLWRKSINGNMTRSAYDEEQGLSESSECFDEKMRVTVALSRYSSGGHCNLFFDGGRSQIRSYDEEQKRSMMPQQNFNKVIPLEGGGTLNVIPTEAQPTRTIATEAAGTPAASREPIQI
jgi:replicative DNA helicase/5S rRNA maturation endonuclease (ribonuclease M5)